MVMSSVLSNYFEEATKLPAAIGAVCGGFTGLLAGISPSLVSGFGPLVLARAIAVAAAPTALGVVFGAVSGGLLGVLVAFAIPELDSPEQTGSTSVFGR